MASIATAGRHVAFLRGINVGGRRVTGAQLCAPFEAAGFEGVASFLASGNVTFVATETDGLAARIGTALEAALGFGVDVHVRTAAEIADIVGRRPFTHEVLAATDGKLQVTCLRDRPTPASVEEAMAHATDQDRLKVIGREWYWLPAAGISSSPLDAKTIERALGRGTTRTLNTMVRLNARLQSEVAG